MSTWHIRSAILLSGLLEEVSTSHLDSLDLLVTDANKQMPTVVGVLFALHGTLTITALSSLPVFLLAHFVSHVSREVWLAVYICLTSCVHFFWLRVSLMMHAIALKIDGAFLQTRRLRAGARARQYAADFLKAYGLRASLAERHGESDLFSIFCNLLYANHLSRVAWLVGCYTGLLLWNGSRLVAARHTLLYSLTGIRNSDENLTYVCEDFSEQHS